MDSVLAIPRGAASGPLVPSMGADGTVVGVDPALRLGRILLHSPEGRIAADTAPKDRPPYGRCMRVAEFAILV